MINYCQCQCNCYTAVPTGSALCRTCGGSKPFHPAFDMPTTPAEALQVIEAWGNPTCYTFTSARAKRCAELIQLLLAVQGEPVAYAVFASNGNIRIWCADPVQVETLRQQYGEALQPLYAVPHPAEQQPAPDVSALVEALEEIAQSCDSGRHDGLPEDGPALSDVEAWLVANDALAAHDMYPDHYKPNCTQCAGMGCHHCATKQSEGRRV